MREYVQIAMMRILLRIRIGSSAFCQKLMSNSTRMYTYIDLL